MLVETPFTGEKISESYRFEFPANTAVVSTPPPGSWLAFWTSQIELMVSADAVEVRNDLQGGPHSKAIENKKTEYVLSEILVPVIKHINSTECANEFKFSS